MFAVCRYPTDQPTSCGGWTRLDCFLLTRMRVNVPPPAEYRQVTVIHASMRRKTLCGCRITRCTAAVGGRPRSGWLVVGATAVVAVPVVVVVVDEGNVFVVILTTTAI